MNRVYAFAPLAANNFGQLRPEFLRFLWTLAYHATRHYISVPLTELPLSSGNAPSEDQDSPQVVRFKRLLGRIFAQDQLQVLTAVYEALTHRVYGHTFHIQADMRYWTSLSDLSSDLTSVWTPSSQLSSQESSATSSQFPPLPSHFPPLASLC